MSSELEDAVQSLRTADYTALVIATAVTYDYIITFTREINFIWQRPWTSVSTMFLIVRYIGLSVALRKFVDARTRLGTVLFIMADYAYILFLGAADMVMVLRVYAMYNRSKLVLGLLLAFYVAMIVVYLVAAIIYNDPNTGISMHTDQVLDMSFCYDTLVSKAKIGAYRRFPRLGLAVLLLIFVWTRVCVDSYMAYKTTGRWRANEYISLLVREGTLYFVAHLFRNIEFGEDMLGTLMYPTAFILFFTLSPRFIMSVRGLYLQNMLCASGGRTSLEEYDSGIDSGFGIGKLSRTTTWTLGELGLADVGANDTVELRTTGKTDGVEC